MVDSLVRGGRALQKNPAPVLEPLLTAVPFNFEILESLAHKV